MAHPDPAQIRNVAVLGHRGSGKTSLVEAMLFAAGETNRLGSVAEGTTVADFDDDERRRTMSISASLCHLTWNGVKVNLIDTPGEPSFQGDTLTALRAVDAALMVLNATSGVEVQTERLWARAEELGLPRAAVVNMLDRERADFDATMAALKELAPGAVAIQIPIGSEAGFRGVVNLVSMTATTYDGGSPTGSTGPIPDDLADAGPGRARGAHRRGGRERRRPHREVPRGRGDHHRGADRGDPRRREGGADLPRGLRGGRRRRSASTGRSTSLAEALPSPADAAPREAVDIASGEAVTIALAEDGPVTAFCFKTLADQFSGRINLLRVVSGTLAGDSPRDLRADRRQGAGRPALHPAGQGPRAAAARSAPATSARSPSSRRSRPATSSRPAPAVAFPPIDFPPPLMSFAVTARSQADEDKMHASPAAHDRRGPDPRRPPRRADRRLPRGRPLADARRGDRRAHRAALRRGAWTWRPPTCPIARRSPGRPRPRASTRSRAAGAASTATAGSGSSRSRAATASSSSTRSWAAPSRGRSSRRSRRAWSRRCARAASPATRWWTSA